MLVGASQQVGIGIAFQLVPSFENVCEDEGVEMSCVGSLGDE
jgi:hypothetical protein